MSLSIDDRPDYMLEAFLEEQQILIRPLLLRRLSLLATLDLKSQMLEKMLTACTKGKCEHHSKTSKTSHCHQEQLKMQTELLSLSEEKIQVTRQLQDVALRQMDVMLEVEGALESAAKKEQSELDSKNATRKAAATAVAVQQISEEVWCFCKRPDDGRPMVACDNGKCGITWWHLDCLERYIETKKVGNMPEESGTWICPVCSAEQGMVTPPGGRKIKMKHEV